MSNYQGLAYNPKTDLIQVVQFLDDHFGKHEYGVCFSANEIYPAAEVLIVREMDDGKYRTFYRGDIDSFRGDEVSLIEACRAIKAKVDSAMNSDKDTFKHE